LVSALKWRWSLDRVAAFCSQHQALDSVGAAGAYLRDEDWSGPLYERPKGFSAITYVARITGGKLAYYQVWARKRNRVWLLELGTLEELRKPRFVGYAF
jgi:hypothetical protein